MKDTGKHNETHHKLQSQINDLQNKYNSIKSFLWSQFIWRRGTQNLNMPQQQQQINPYLHTITNHFDRNQYTCNQCMYLSKEYVKNDKQNDKYCKLLDSNSIHKTKTIVCYPVKVDDNYNLKSVCESCGSRTMEISTYDNQGIPPENDYQKLLKLHGYKRPLSEPCKTIPAYNEDPTIVKNCMFVDNQFLQNESHSCRQNYCDNVQENDSTYTYDCNPVKFDAQGNIQSICTNPSLRKKQYVVNKTPEEQLFYRENNERNDFISGYAHNTVEALENMNQNMMKTIEADDHLKRLCNSNDSYSFDVRGYDLDRYAQF